LTGISPKAENEHHMQNLKLPFAYTGLLDQYDVCFSVKGLFSSHCDIPSDLSESIYSIEDRASEANR